MSYVGVTLYDPKNAENIGAVARLAYNWDARFLNILDGRIQHHPTNIVRADQHLPMSELDSDAWLNIKTPSQKRIAIEIDENASCISSFIHPCCTEFVFGPEDSSIPPHILDACDHVVKIPTRGCMNLAMTVGIVLFHNDLQKRQQRRQSQVDRRRKKALENKLLYGLKEN